MKKYLVKYALVWNEPEEIEAEDKVEACEEMYCEIISNIGFYIDCIAEEIEDNEED